MHYLISYDIENDRLREKLAKTLERHGCHRVQRSVFVAPAMPRRHWQAMMGELRQLCRAGSVMSASDSVFLVSLDEAEMPDITVLGSNNILPLLRDDVRKIII